MAGPAPPAGYQWGPHAGKPACHRCGAEPWVAGSPCTSYPLPLPSTAAPAVPFPFIFFCLPRTNCRVACGGEPLTLDHWREQLRLHGPPLAAADADLFVYVRDLGQILRSDADVEEIARRFTHRHKTPTLQLLTRAEIAKHRSALASKSARSSHGHCNPVASHRPASLLASTSSLNWADPRVTIETWVARKHTLERCRKILRAMLSAEHLIPDLANIVVGMLGTNRYDNRRLENVQSMLDYLQGKTEHPFHMEI